MSISDGRLPRGKATARTHSPRLAWFTSKYIGLASHSCPLTTDTED